jgi:hypothetical protein
VVERTLSTADGGRGVSNRWASDKEPAKYDGVRPRMLDGVQVARAQGCDERACEQHRDTDRPCGGVVTMPLEIARAMQDGLEKPTP